MDRKTFLKSLALLPLVTCNMKLQEFPSIANALPNTEKMPVLFVGHGSPMNALEDNAFTRSLRKLGEQFKQEGKKPAAILVVSAHWLTRGSYVNIAPKPETIHDFGGFPKELFEAQYPAAGSPELAKETAKRSALIQETDDWGLDHGAWTILMHLFPEADIPVFQLSIDYYQPLQYHLDLAAQLNALREKGVLIIGSGNIVHNLRLSMERLRNGDTRPFDWAVEFDTWVSEKIAGRDFQSLVTYEKAGESGKLSVPTPDHYIPMLYSLGLAGEKEEIKQAYEEVALGGISMRTFQVGA
jgi:4,5-DOPA dioxygenase extradiol